MKYFEKVVTYTISIKWASFWFAINWAEMKEDKKKHMRKSFNQLKVRKKIHCTRDLPPVFHLWGHQTFPTHLKIVIQQVDKYHISTMKR